ncbi:RFC checkpoint protein Rad17 [Conoideocrella luteorostrata]|uniref:RFC checkpoint protein Rad17 n=1 Tax=Conoideocrella luteorostrata TaxID=1105319 RepID=A0AAJ0CMU1_9HYPO|nr:RFC checkpoint protein Rad17 [Conoideocrella luteorostrata]
MSGIVSYVLGGDRKTQAAINLPSVEVHHVETNPDRRARSLKHLLKANHVNYSVLYSQNRFDNHNAHILSSAYLLGATPNQLQDIYEEQVKELEAWTPSPAELIDNDWVDFLGDGQYQRAFVDFFEDKLAMEYAYDWKKVVEHYLFSSERPLIHGLICGLGHPLIQMGYAYEMDSKEIAMEALTLASVQHDFLYRYISDPAYTKQSSISAKSVLDLLIKLSQDEELDKLPKTNEYANFESVITEYQDIVMKYWNAWDISDPLKDFENSQHAAVALFVSSVDPSSRNYNFFIVHLLTTSYALRVLLPFFPVQHHIGLVRQWWLLVIAAFILKGRPCPNPENVDKDLKGRDWKYVQDKALNSSHSGDAHYVKAIRAMRDLANTWGDKDQYYLRAAATFVDNFHGWTY